MFKEKYQLVILLAGAVVLVLMLVDLFADYAQGHTSTPEAGEVVHTH